MAGVYKIEIAESEEDLKKRLGQQKTASGLIASATAVFTQKPTSKNCARGSTNFGKTSGDGARVDETKPLKED